MTTLRITAKADCGACHGEGTVYDTVDWWGASASMPSICGCIEEQIPEDAPDDVSVTVVASPETAFSFGRRR